VSFRGRGPLAAIVLVAAVAFVLLIVPAMLVYPGGTWMDPSTRGHDFWLNFFCDLLHSHGLNGQPNVVGARFATAAMLVLVVGFWPFWIVNASLVKRPLATPIRVAGTMSVLGLIAVPLTPSDRFGAIHGVAVLLAAVPGLVAAACATAGLASQRATRAIGALGAATLVTAAIDSYLYARHMASGGAVTPHALPALQKVAALFLLAWMVGVAWRARRE